VQKHVKYNPYADVQLNFLDFVRNKCGVFSIDVMISTEHFLTFLLGLIGLLFRQWNDLLSFSMVNAVLKST